MTTTTKLLIGIVAFTCMISIVSGSFMTPEMQGYQKWNPEMITPPSEYEKLEMFLAADNISEHEYIYGGEDCYICTHFATDLAKSLNASGYKSGVVSLSAKNHGDQGHLLTWVILDNTTHVIESGNDDIYGSFENFEKTIDGDRYTIRYESIASGERKCNIMYQMLM